MQHIPYFLTGGSWTYSSHQHKQIHTHHERLAGKSIFSLNLQALVRFLGDFRHPAPYKSDTISVLSFQIHIFEVASKHSQIHIEAKYFSFGKSLFNLASLLHSCSAAHFGARDIPNFFVSGTHAMHETDSFGIVNGGVRSGTIIFFQIGICYHMVVNAVSIFFFLLSLEKVKAACNQYSIRKDSDSIGQYHIERIVKD